MHRYQLLTCLLALALAAALANRAAAHPGSGIVVDDGGDVYFTDTGRGVWRIDPEGELTLISETALHWLVIDREGTFAQAPDEFGKWFWRVTPRGAKPTLIACSDFPCVVGRDGNLYYANMHSLQIVRRTPAGEESDLVTPDDYNLDLDRPLGVNGIACGPDGALYLTSIDSLSQTVGAGDHALHRLDMNGDIKTIASNFVTDLLPEKRAASRGAAAIQPRVGRGRRRRRVHRCHRQSLRDENYPRGRVERRADLQETLDARRRRCLSRRGVRAGVRRRNANRRPQLAAPGPPGDARRKGGHASDHHPRCGGGAGRVNLDGASTVGGRTRVSGSCCDDPRAVEFRPLRKINRTPKATTYR